jgi:hypothetical protein
MFPVLLEPSEEHISLEGLDGFPSQGGGGIDLLTTVVLVYIL